jgi:hypothetical protein
MYYRCHSFVEVLEGILPSLLTASLSHHRMYIASAEGTH